jgi:hypothetical protein
MPEDEIRPSDLHCGGCDFYLGLEECVLPPGCCIQTDTGDDPELCLGAAPLEN